MVTVVFNRSFIPGLAVVAQDRTTLVATDASAAASGACAAPVAAHAAINTITIEHWLSLFVQTIYEELSLLWRYIAAISCSAEVQLQCTLYKYRLYNFDFCLVLHKKSDVLSSLIPNCSSNYFCCAVYSACS